MSMTISCTWAGQSTDLTTLDITRSLCTSIVYDYQVTYMACVGWQRPQECGKPCTRLRGSGTLGTVGGSGWGRFVA